MTSQGIRSAVRSVDPSSYVTLEFACNACAGPVCATLHCQGDVASLDRPPTVPLTCPHCDCVNNVTFDERGSVLATTARRGRITHTMIWN